MLLLSSSQYSILIDAIHEHADLSATEIRELLGHLESERSEFETAAEIGMRIDAAGIGPDDLVDVVGQAAQRAAQDATLSGTTGQVAFILGLLGEVDGGELLEPINNRPRR